MIETIRSIRPLDIVDILIVSYLIYRTMLLIRGTRAVQRVLGITSILLLYFISAYFELQTLRVLLKTFLGSLLVVIVILFQAEIRRGLARMGKPRFFRTKQASDNDLEEIVRAASLLARRHLGALIVLERDNGLRDFLEGGFLSSSLPHPCMMVVLLFISSASTLPDAFCHFHRTRILTSATAPVTVPPLGFPKRQTRSLSWFLRKPKSFLWRATAGLPPSRMRPSCCLP